eukprot:TRINITY_DN6330_c0_g1_i1.p1 TRINITY_DN6330_c0_g1~~TRINITY_DN6330_c0_g1_i1.p1  ORF type:complete len:375 (+),score=95.90 TRINITY_DN6330_c0_g1_i1:54-1178(+)
MDFIERSISNQPELEEVYRQCLHFYSKKLWHQLTTQLEILAKHPTMSRNDNLLQLYTQFIKSFEAKINPLKLSLIVVKASSQMPPSDAIVFLRAIATDVVKDKEARILLLSNVANLELKSGDVAACKAAVESLKSDLDSLAMADPAVHAAYYVTALDFFKQVGPATEYFRNALMYLSFVSMENFSPEEQSRLAFEIGLSALVGTEIYNFGELLKNPILESLKPAGNQWVGDLLHAFNLGDINAYRSIANSAQFRAVPALANAQAILTEKIHILALIDMSFSGVAEQRVLSFATIAERTQLPLYEVELCVMKALSLNLIRGVIDQVASEVTITWVQPRVLDLKQIASMKTRLDTWRQKVHSTLLFVEGETGELMA